MSSFFGPRLRIGHLSTFYHTAVLLMAGPDTCKRLGAEVQWRLFGTGPAIVNEFEKGSLDLAYIGLPPAVIGMERGVGIKCIAGGHIEGTVLSAKKQYKGYPETDDLHDVLKQFRGLKIGVPGKGSIHDVIITECLERLDLKSEVSVINFQWADQITEAVVKNQVAAAIGTPALAAAVERYADGRIIYPAAKLWPNNPSYGILADTGYLKNNRAQAENFLVMHEEATSLLRQDPQKAANTIADYIGFIDEAFIMRTLAISPGYCAMLTDDYISSTMEFVKTLRKLGYIRREITADEIFDRSLINNIHPEKDHYRQRMSAC